MSRGRQILVQQIRDRNEGVPERRVSWVRLLILGGLILAGIAIASALSR